MSLKAPNPAGGSGDVLAAGLILEHLPALLRHELQELTVLQQTDSTNSALARMPPERRHAHALLAEEQTGGRGRRQRSWHSPPGGNIYLSLGWRFDSQAISLSTLPLVTALCLCRALDRAGLKGHGIKWPNDVLIDGAKLAGILVESQAVGFGPLLAVIGIGLNVRMPGAEGDHPGVIIDRAWTDLASHLPEDRRFVSRAEMAALLLEQLLPSLRRLETEGFAAYHDEWRQRDLLTGRRLRLEGNGGFRYGQALGIENDGGLKVDIDGYGPQVLYAADVSIQYD